MAGRNTAKLAEVRDLIGAPKDTPLVEADASNPASLKAMCERTRCVLTTVGPYQLYGSELVAACAASGTDYLDLNGEPAWARQMIDDTRCSREKQRCAHYLVGRLRFDSV
jgi:short subunit dehydrogenase-like uncharacterized protein